MTKTQTIEDALDDLFSEQRLPRATYRLQFSPSFTFYDAEALIDYLHQLGISDVYTSPLFKPRSGSTHGYDVVDPGALNDVIGGDDGFNRLVDRLRDHDMGLMLDIVPNHMGIGTDNDWWTDVLKHGPSSVYAHYFDIDWRSQNRALDDKVLLPVLGDHYGRVLERGEFELVYWHGDFYLHYYEHHFPLNPGTYIDILQRVYIELLQQEKDRSIGQELLSIITQLRHLPPYNTRSGGEIVEMRREQTIARYRLLNLFDGSETIRQAMEAALRHFNGDPDEPATFDPLDDVLSRQPYRLAYWRTASDEINYRRFFDINDMAAIRIEEMDVFMDTHRLTLQLLAEGKVTGLRIDHPDGLWNPNAYFARLQEEFVVACMLHRLNLPYVDRRKIQERLEELANTADGYTRWPLYVLVEKILSETEPLPYDWQVYGTTGYEFLNTVNNLFVNADSEADFDRIYHDFVDEVVDFDDLIGTRKKMIMDEALASEIYSRSAQLHSVIEQNRRYQDFTRNSLAFAISETIAALNIYRTYITGPDDITVRDRYYIDQAIAMAKKRNATKPDYIFDFLHETLLLDNLDDIASEQQAELQEFVMKFQQITGPVMAKSVEDTTFYIYNRLVSLNEVGGHPVQFGHSVDAFHEHNLSKTFPHTMLSTSTHDTKRSEDVRARINVLSEMPQLWEAAVNRWSEMNAPIREGQEVSISRNDEYLLYQTLIGAYPLVMDMETDDLSVFKERIITYMHKAINEAKVHSTWVNHNAAYAEAISQFIESSLDNPAFREDLEAFQRPVSFYGFINSLAQTVLKLTSPGIPDIYQGNELWDYSLVDPDNRRPVDFDKRRGLLTDILARRESDLAGLIEEIAGQPETGVIKLHTTLMTLHLRREYPDLFTDGEYLTLGVTGDKVQHVCTFARALGDERLIVVVPRLAAGLTDYEAVMPLGESIWGETQIVQPRSESRRYRNIFTGAIIEPQTTGNRAALPVAELLAEYPVAVLQALT